MLKDILKNFRDRVGNFFNEDLVCSDCGQLSEVYYEWIDGESRVVICKGCLTKAIEEIDKAILGSVREKNIEVLDEDDGYPD